MVTLSIVDRWSVALLLTGLTGAALPASAQTAPVTPTCPDPAVLAGAFEEPLATVRYLADDALEGRLAGSAGERCAADYIAARLEALGLQGAGPNGSYFQDVPLASTLNPHAEGESGRNVLAILEGGDSSLRHEVIVIGAHYDHLGRGEFGSMEPGATAIHNGADDNASGVAAMLRAAALLAEGRRPDRSVLFMAFTGEESGLLGSAHFTSAPTVPLETMQAMINLDMVGRLEGDPLIVYGVGTATEWRALLEPQAAASGIELALHPEGYGASDHTSFYTSDVPVLHFFTNSHADYHKPSDDWDRVDAAGIEKVARIVAGVTRSVAESATRITLVPGAGEPPRLAAGGGNGAYLGTVPDFAPAERGVRLSGVTPGSPGDLAGMQKGDILIRLGGREVPDLQGFTDALQAHRPGDEVEIVVIRDGREVTLRAVLGSRGG